MSEVSFAEFKDEEVKAFLNDLDNKLKKIDGGKKEYSGLLSAIVYADIMDHFDKETGSDGPWEEWSSSYKEEVEGSYDKKVTRTMGSYLKAAAQGNEDKKAKAKKKLESMAAPKILQRTGKMRNNFTPNKVRSVSSGLLWYNNAKTKGGFPYAYAHDEGGPKLPKRDFMWLSAQAMDKISEQTLQFMLEKGI